MESSDGRGSAAADEAAIRAHLLAALNGRLAGLTGESVDPAGRPAPNSGSGRADLSTVGTGSFVAIGCTAIALVVLAIGIVVLVLTRWI